MQLLQLRVEPRVLLLLPLLPLLPVHEAD